MRTEYKRDMNHNYLILHGEGEVDTGSYQVRMLVGNVMPSVLKCRIQEMDGIFSVYYDITSRHSLSCVYEEKKLFMEDLKLIFGSFIQAMEEMSEFLLNPGQLLISPDYMYMDVEKKQILFCCFPGQSNDVQKQFLALIEYILPKIDHGDKAAVTLGYGIYRKALEDNFQLEHVKKELYGIREEDDKYGHTTDKKEEITWEKNDTYSQIQREPGEWILDDDQKKERLVENAFGMEMQKEADQEKRTLGTLWKKILICGICGVTLLAAAAAKKYGILPGVSTEVFLGMIAAGMAAGMVLFWAVKKIKRGLEVSKEKKERDIMRRKKVSDPRNTNFLYGDKKDDFGDFREIKKEETVFAKQEQQEYTRGNYGETVILSANPVQGPASLVSREPGELATIYLQEDIVVIGKMETAADAVIDLPTVSRMHAKIRRRDGEYYLSDLNSRNGTAVNGRLLHEGEDYCLKDQDEVDFAQARYVFLK